MNQLLKHKVLFVLTLCISAAAGLLVSLLHHNHQLQKQGLQNVPALTRRTYHSPTSLVSQLHNDPKAGEKIFNAFCKTCHGKHPRILINAPKITNHLAWQGLAQLGQDKLLRMTIRGNGAMPARGGCYECSDKLLKQTLEYILKESQQYAKH